MLESLDQAESWGLLAFCVFAFALLLYLRLKGVVTFEEFYRTWTKNDTAARLFGLAQLVMAAILAYPCAYIPYRRALAHQPTIHYLDHAIVAPVMLALMGIVFTLFGSYARRIMPMDYDCRKYTPLQWSFLIVVCAVALGTLFGFQHLLEWLGYTRIR